jgi:hypothetical protein
MIACREANYKALILLFDDRNIGGSRRIDEPIPPLDNFHGPFAVKVNEQPMAKSTPIGFISANLIAH